MITPLSWKLFFQTPASGACRVNLMTTSIRHAVKTSGGFTLFEILVVITVMITIGLVGSDILLNVIKGANKVEITNKVKQNGSLAMDVMERKIRNALSVYSGVDVAGIGIPITSSEACLTNIIVKNSGPPDVYSRFFLVPEGAQNGYIAMAEDSAIDELPDVGDATLTAKTLTNFDDVGGVSVTATPVPCFTTFYNPTQPLVIRVSFTLRQAKKAPSRQDFVAQVPFETTISLRTY